MPSDGLLGEPESYDAYIEDECPRCGADVGVAGVFWFCDSGHMGHVERAG